MVRTDWLTGCAGVTTACRFLAGGFPLTRCCYHNRAASACCAGVGLPSGHFPSQYALPPIRARAWLCGFTTTTRGVSPLDRCPIKHLCLLQTAKRQWFLPFVDFRRSARVVAVQAKCPGVVVVNLCLNARDGEAKVKKRPGSFKKRGEHRYDHRSDCR